MNVGALVLYKQKPARVTGLSGDKLELDTGGGAARVRPKDVLALHPGPVSGLGALHPQEGNPAEVWELLEGETLPLSDLADLAFGGFTPESALSVWAWVQDGTYFEGMPDAVRPRSREQVEARVEAGRAKLEEARAWDDFILALRGGEVTDSRRLAEVEALALGRTQKSRVLAALGRPETPQEAHALLLSLGVWDETRNPYPSRHGVDLNPVDLPVPPLPNEPRLDLTHLPAFAIDDEGSADPDDAISLERAGGGWKLWVHVSDVAALAPMESDLDRAARERGATLYLPDRTVPMLPPEVTRTLGLGLSEVSPALSFEIELDEDFAPKGVEIHLTTARVSRLTYAEAQARLDAGEFADFARFAHAARRRREEAGAVLLDLPEVRLRVVKGEIVVKPLPPLESRIIVQEAMMLAGWGAATWASQRELALPFAAQDPPVQRREDSISRTSGPPRSATTFPPFERIEGDSLPDQWARRKTLARTRFAPAPGAHAGLGLGAYAQATSPMRRYLDLVVHQQLRAELAGERPLSGREIARPLSGREIAARIGEAELGSASVRAAERASNRHWTLVHLRRSLQWRGEATVVDRRGAVATVLVPDLALDTAITTPHEVGETISLEVAAVDLPDLGVRFRALG